MKNKILIIEDERTINDVLKEYLEVDGYECIQAFNGLDGLTKFNTSISLVICDVMMPKLDGYGVVEEIRKQSDVSIIMLTALNEEENIIKGYDLGVDEYVSKPFSPKIIVKKVNAILTRNKTNISDEVLTFGILSMSLLKRSIMVNDVSIKLSKKEFDLMTLFTQHKGQTFTRDHLLNYIWGYDYFGDERVVDTAIKRLRKKLNDAGSYIVTERGMGYKFEVISWN